MNKRVSITSSSEDPLIVEVDVLEEAGAMIVQGRNMTGGSIREVAGPDEGSSWKSSGGDDPVRILGQRIIQAFVPEAGSV